jgi:hypothetical protein
MCEIGATMMKKLAVNENAPEIRYTKMEMYQLGNLNHFTGHRGGIPYDRRVQ